MSSIRRLFLAFGTLTLMGCSGLFYQPDRFLYYPPDKNGFVVEDVYFDSSDGTKLHGWFIPAATPKDPKNNLKPKGTIVQFHGNAENITSHYASLVWLTRQGYNLFTFDYRGYGRSEGKPSQQGTYRDGLAALGQAWQLHKASKAGQDPSALFIVYGQSLGGIVSLRAFMDFERRDSTSLVVMDSTFVSYKDMAQQVAAGFWLTWLISPLGRVLVSDEYGTTALVPKLKNRLLVIHDRKDRVVGFKNGKKLFNLATGVPDDQKDFWELDQGRHIGCFSLDTPENRERFLTYLDNVRAGTKSAASEVKVNP